jgi:cellulose synthase/poly-beta-1,6-N-acetylglucosamine synthase-like glycosyltransferase
VSDYTPHVTVAVPVKDRRERMLRCLDALLALGYPSYDVLVLDNESSDGTAEACRERAAGAPVPLRVEVLAGSVGHLRNRAGELAEGEIVAFTDSDCMPAPGWLAGGVPPFADPGIGVVQGKTLPEPAAELVGWDATIDVREYTARFESCNLLVRREAFVDSRGFDERVGHFWEDTAAGWAILREGWRPAFAPGALVHHDVTHPGLRWWLRRGLRYGNGAAVVRDYPELRRELLWGRYFLRARNAKALGFVLGLALAPLDVRAVALAAPYLWMRRPRSLAPAYLLHDVVEPTLLDLSILAGSVAGSIRWRSVLL